MVYKTIRIIYSVLLTLFTFVLILFTVWTILLYPILSERNRSIVEECIIYPLKYFIPYVIKYKKIPKWSELYGGVVVESGSLYPIPIYLLLTVIFITAGLIVWFWFKKNYRKRRLISILWIGIVIITLLLYDTGFNGNWNALVSIPEYTLFGLINGLMLSLTWNTFLTSKSMSKEK